MLVDVVIAWLKTTLTGVSEGMEENTTHLANTHTEHQKFTSSTRNH